MSEFQDPHPSQDPHTGPGAGPAWGPPPPYPGARRKSTALAGILSFLLPGLGQVYTGLYHRGFIHVVVVGTDIVLLSSNAIRGLEPFFGIFLAFFWAYTVLDAVRCAQLYNLAGSASDEAELLQRMQRGFGERGSGVAGGALIVLGALLLAHTALDIDLSWIEDWWPLLLIGLGVYMIRRGRKERSD